MRRLPSRSLRLRIAVAFFAAALLVSGLVATATYGLARTFLTRQRTDSAVRQSFNGLRFANEYLTRPEEERTLEALVAFLQARGTSDVVVVDAGLPVSSSVSVTEQSIPAQLRRVVAGGGVGYVVFGESPRRIAVGSPVPNTALQGYFIYTLQDLDATLGVLARVLVGVVGGAVVIAGALGLRLADRTIEPVRRASEAAQRVAEGSLETRLEETGSDELASLAASFNRMTEALSERIVRERRFVSDASHELRTPLTALKTSVDYLAERSEGLPERLGPAAQVASEEVRSLERLVDDLLELSRVEAGGVHVSREDVDLSDFATEVVRRRAPGADVRVEAQPGLVVRTDKARLERVVGNLVENAVIHGGEGVSIEVGAPDGVARITVSDRGPGIPPGDLHSIFERFWRGDRARRRGGRAGAGLGLAIARENAHVLGADLRVRSKLGEGTTFEVVLAEEGA